MIIEISVVVMFDRVVLDNAKSKRTVVLKTAVPYGLPQDALRSSPGRVEILVAWCLIAVAAALRVVYVFHYRVDSDEPQHLYIARALSKGLLAYRDFFDNHTPLFHTLFAPLVAAIGDRPDLLIFMRLAMLPLWAASLWLVYLIALEVFSRRTALWAMAGIALMPVFFSCSVEFRTDNLWTVLWLLSVLTLVRGRPTVMRFFLAGLLLGAAAGTSQKTLFLLAGLIVSWLGTAMVTANTRRQTGRFRQAMPLAAAMVGGFSIIPSAIAAYFWARGAIGPFLYCIMDHNMIAGHPQDLWVKLLVSLALLLAAIVAAVAMSRFYTGGENTSRRIFLVFLSAMSSVLLIYCPINAPQNFLPIYPVAIIVVVAIIEALLAWVSARKGGFFSRAPYMLFPVLLLVELGLVAAAAPWQNNMAWSIDQWRDVLRLTDPQQTVMDTKGELIFRRRAYYYALESMTEKRVRMGLLEDRIPESLVAAQTCVVKVRASRMSKRSQDFIKDNYIKVGSLMAAGKRLLPVSPQSGDIEFDVMVPARYVVMTPAGPGAGQLNSQPCLGPVYLAPGRYRYSPSAGERDLTLIWAQAIERGFSPYPLN